MSLHAITVCAVDIVLLEKNIEERRNEDGENEVSDASTRITRFVPLTIKPLDGSCSGKRFSR